MVNSVEFGKRLEKIMREHDLTASAFADRIEVGRSSISHILSGRNKPSLDFVMKVVQEFDDVELYWLLNGKGHFPAQAVAENPSERKTVRHDELPFSESTFKKEGPLPAQEHKHIPQEHRRPDSDFNEPEIERIVIFYNDGTFKNFNP